MSSDATARLCPICDGDGILAAGEDPVADLRATEQLATDERKRRISAENALVRIAAQQKLTLRWLEHNGIVFDGPLGTDPSNWQHVAFSIYTDLCEVDTIARLALQGDAR